VAGLVFVGLALAVFGAALFFGETFAHRDLGALNRPAKSIMVPLARATGGLPLWNPFFGSGQPYAANPQQEMFHPLTALLFVLPFEWAFRLQVILPPFLAAAVMFALLRTLRRSRAAALFGAVTWGFGGYMLSLTNLVPTLFAVSVLPLLVLFAVRLGRATGVAAALGDVAGLGVSFCLVALAGEPATLLAMPAIVAAAVWCGGTTRTRAPAAGERVRARARAVALVGAGFALGVLLSAATLVPAVDHAGKTIRASGVPAAAADEWSLPPVRLAELFVPAVLGHVDERNPARYWGRSFYPNREFPFYYSLHPGLLAGLLAVAGGLAAARRRALIPWLVCAGVGIVVALGVHLPLWPLLRKLPLLSGIRFPEKFVLLLIFPVVVLAAHGFDHVVQGPRRARRRLLVALAAFAVAGAVAALVLWMMGRAPGASPSLAIAARDGARVALVSLALLAALAARARVGRAQGALAVCAVVALDLGLAGRDLVPTVPLARVAAPPPFLAPLVKKQGDQLLFHFAAWDPKLGHLPGLAAPPAPAQWGIANTLETDFDLTQLRWTHEATQLFWKALERDQSLFGPILQRRGVTAILRFRRGVTRERGRLLVPAGAPSPLELLESASAQPFAFAARRVEIVEGGAGWVEAMVRLRDQAAHTACVDAAELATFPGPPAPADVRVAARTPAQALIEVAARGPAPSFLAINQTWDTGWRATIDGAPARLLRTDHALSGLVVPPGNHRVELVYQNRALDRGLALSLAGALVALALVMVSSRRRRRAGSDPLSPVRGGEGQGEGGPVSVHVPPRPVP
jgi:hypothetical protein